MGQGGDVARDLRSQALNGRVRIGHPPGRGYPKTPFARTSAGARVRPCGLGISPLPVLVPVEAAHHIGRRFFGHASRHSRQQALEGLPPRPTAGGRVSNPPRELDRYHPLALETARTARASRRQPARQRGDLVGLARGVLRGPGGGGGGDHRPQRRRQEHAPEVAQPRHRADRGGAPSCAAGWAACWKSAPSSTPS